MDVLKKAYYYNGHAKAKDSVSTTNDVAIIEQSGTTPYNPRAQRKALEVLGLLFVTTRKQVMGKKNKVMLVDQQTRLSWLLF